MKHYPKAAFASYLIRVKVDRKYYDPDLLSLFINSIYGRKYIPSVVSQQVGQANVNGKKLLSLPIPFPPVVEQERIVQEVQRLLSFADNVETGILQGLTESRILWKQILKTAFEGKLVPQDPSDEPAEELLERIRQEKLSFKDKNYSSRINNRYDTKQMKLI